MAAPHGYLPAHAGEPDWVLLCDGKQELPCHSIFLAALSPVLAGLLETQPREDGKIAVPFRLADGAFLSAELGTEFLLWAYKNDISEQLSVQDAWNLAELSHHWQIPGLALPCDAVLAETVRTQAAGGRSAIGYMQDQGVDVVGTALLAARCGLKATLARCELAIIGHINLVGPDVRLAQLPGASFQRIALGMVTAIQNGTTGFHCEVCRNPQRAFRKVGPDKMACLACGWAMDLPPGEPGQRMWRNEVAIRPLQPVNQQQLQAWALQVEHGTVQHLELPRQP